MDWLRCNFNSSVRLHRDIYNRIERIDILRIEREDLVARFEKAGLNVSNSALPHWEGYYKTFPDKEEDVIVSTPIWGISGRVDYEVVSREGNTIVMSRKYTGCEFRCTREEHELTAEQRDLLAEFGPRDYTDQIITLPYTPRAFPSELWGDDIVTTHNCCEADCEHEPEAVWMTAEEYEEKRKQLLKLLEE